MILVSTYACAFFFQHLFQCVTRHTGKMAIAEEQQLNRGQGSLSWELDSKTWVDIHIHVDTLQGQQEALHELKVFVQSDLRKKKYRSNWNILQMLIIFKKSLLMREKSLSHFLEDFHAAFLNHSSKFAWRIWMDVQTREEQKVSQKEKKKKNISSLLFVPSLTSKPREWWSH